MFLPIQTRILQVKRKRIKPSVMDSAKKNKREVFGPKCRNGINSNVSNRGKPQLNGHMQIWGISPDQANNNKGCEWL